MVVSPLEYETIGLMGSNLGIADLDEIAALNFEVNDIGLDSIEIGAALGVAAEAGLLAFGDSQRALELIQEIRLGTPLGRLLGSGAAITGKVLGIERVPVVKNQALSAYDPAVPSKAPGDLCHFPSGADHTCGLTIRARLITWIPPFKSIYRAAPRSIWPVTTRWSLYFRRIRIRGCASGHSLL